MNTSFRRAALALAILASLAACDRLRPRWRGASNMTRVSRRLTHCGWKPLSAMMRDHTRV